MSTITTRPNDDSTVLPRFGTEFRTDLQGLRAVAVLLVLTYHAGVPFLSGGYVGVDVFFVLSGYLITGIMARELLSTGHLSMQTFYARRILRIVPAATVVLIATAIATVVWLPITQWRSTAAEIVGSAFYVSNWQFAASTDYLNTDSAPSPLQHFWSLAIEEQYYLIWPALLVLALTVAKRWLRSQGKGFSPLTIATIVMATVTLISFCWSLVAVSNSPEAAYFLTPVRIWELGVGSLLALAVPNLRGISTVLKQLLFWGGLLAIISAGFYTIAL
ncbi:acyltransferase [Leucobacter insecticola]|uniref:Acyltransferase n=1 Tax=Leucobacter insecticola TaxID=2714934 RepID=A0A6G8FHN7_9MICO|nr:acyltransferase [Leucobacter insecticola]QIM15874.1 acyltransferase [Leucobacter insecticola]